MFLFLLIIPETSYCNMKLCVNWRVDFKVNVEKQKFIVHIIKLIKAWLSFWYLKKKGGKKSVENFLIFFLFFSTHVYIVMITPNKWSSFLVTTWLLALVNSVVIYAVNVILSCYIPHSQVTSLWSLSVNWPWKNPSCPIFNPSPVIWQLLSYFSHVLKSPYI